MKMIKNDEIIKLVKKYRQDLHKIPEIGFDLYKTHDYLANELKMLGYDFEVVAKTGIVVYIPGEESEAIAFRADMDALNVTEETNIEFKSTHEGKMHACGHDGHMAMVLAFANYLKDKKLKKSVVLIFQPAEEGPGGAVEIIKAGIFKKYNIQAIFGLHLDPSIDEGIFGLKSGVMLSQNGEVYVKITGSSAHGALPHLGSDAIVAASHLITCYQTIVSRRLSPMNPNVITIGKIKGGEAINIIPRHVEMCGTIRTFDPEDFKEIKTKIKLINEGIEKSFNVKVETELKDLYLTVINDEELFNKTIAALDEADYEIIEPLMASEDFSFYQRETKGLFVMLGTKNKKQGYTHPLHSSKFNFNEEVLARGVEFYILQAHIHGVL